MHRRVLVTDDSAAQRQVLARQLSRWGYDVAQAESGPQALALAQSARFDIVLSDWVMPGMSGPEFCRAFRALPQDSYSYFVLISAKSGTAAVADGLASGADDFLTKPIDPAELQARLHAGERILRMETELRHRNRDLQRLYDALQRDLAEARRLQLSLIPDPVIAMDGAEAVFLMQPSGHVGGDLVGWFPLEPGRIALFSIDVSGHGVTSALMAARLAALLSGQSREQNIAFQAGRPLPPEGVVERLNRLLCADQQGDLYLTMIYADICLCDGAVRLVQAGHPHPLHLSPGRPPVWIGDGGFPVGLFPEASYPPVTLHLRPGDRLVIPSDGVTECPGPGGDGGDDLGGDGLATIMQQARGLRGRALHDALIGGLGAHAGTQDFPDDVSAVILDFTGA
jgi:sigma-B regulation protein RsbU (phosphoserine phosphatase)